MTYRTIGLIIALLLTASCTRIANSSREAAGSLNRFKNDTDEAWAGLFTYNPPNRIPQPSSTRFCYKFSSDIVCYDNPQPQLTSPLIGVQGEEGARAVLHAAPQYPDATYVAPTQTEGDIKSQELAPPMFGKKS
jgi:hypothetical protein